MTKPVDVFRSAFSGDKRSKTYDTIRLDENGHLVLFPSFSRYITSWAIYQPHGHGGIWKSMAGCWLVSMLVGFRGRVGLVTPTPSPQRPSTGSIWRPISRTTEGVGFCPLDRAIGVNPGFSLRQEARLVVLVPQHQEAAIGYVCSMFKTYN
jgi:hypothetical protein